MSESGDPSLDDVLSVLEAWHLVVVSNRQPYRHTFDEDDEIAVDRPAGGLTAGLDPVVQKTDGTWVAWGDGDADRETTDDNDAVRVPPEDPAYTLKRVWLSESDVADYYYGFSNRVLWPLCHSLVDRVTFEDRHWERYREVNQKFADSVVETVASDTDDSVDDTPSDHDTPTDYDTVVWFQDYHFGLAPQFVRESIGDEALLSQFWHIPWPEREVFRDCPHGAELLRGLLANDLLGFHVPAYCANFLDCVSTMLPEAAVDWEAWTVSLADTDHRSRVRAFPMGVDTEGIAEYAAAPDEGFWEQFRADYGILDDQQVAVGIDRLDYTKGIPERLAAIERLLEAHPNWLGEFTYVQKATPSRTEIPEYRELGRQVDRAVERINDRFGTDDWQPIIEIDDYLSEEALYGLCRHSDLAIVSSLADGMNLVAMEYVSAQIDRNGVLLLSERAGADELLGDAAVSIDPTDTETFASRLDLALSMPDAERRRRMTALRSTVETTNIQSWMADVFASTLTLDHPPTETDVRTR
ncbi:alpha,alpha-trehalose-phosphate synthase (UDP-forming) [Halohasta salina]|uniref:alpha,alpha-trehalose-phosphate synthase (UDP-forming) n=1 Tax=Halohasta salina TaxID=2961621 RepID=UPI0020A50F9C|nr:trehalose-6-phosphate synthase [Halohasta salina]